MISINSMGQIAAMDGQTVYPISQQKNTPAKPVEKPVDVIEVMNSTAEELVKTDTQKVQVQVKQLQDISDIMGRKLLFNVNEQLGKVVIKVVDPNTDKVIKEIPSAEIQKLQIRIKETIGLLFDEQI